MKRGMIGAVFCPLVCCVSFPNAHRLPSVFSRHRGVTHGGNGLVEIWLGIFGRSPTRRGGGQMCGPDLGVLKT